MQHKRLPTGNCKDLTLLPKDLGGRKVFQRTEPKALDAGPNTKEPFHILTPPTRFSYTLKFLSRMSKQSQNASYSKFE